MFQALHGGDTTDMHCHIDSLLLCSVPPPMAEPPIPQLTPLTLAVLRLSLVLFSSLVV